MLGHEHVSLKIGLTVMRLVLAVVEGELVEHVFRVVENGAAVQIVAGDGDGAGATAAVVRRVRQIFGRVVQLRHVEAGEGIAGRENGWRMLQLVLVVVGWSGSRGRHNVAGVGRISCGDVGRV